MSWLASARNGLWLSAALALFPAINFSQTGYETQGGEYRISGALLGDQTAPSISIGPAGGYLVWQDNVTDGDGLGISARKLSSNLSGQFEQFRVNVGGAGDQQNPQVALLGNGGAVFVWQGGAAGAQKIYMRFLGAGGTFLAGDLPVSAAVFGQANPSVAALADGTIAIVWASYGQDGSLQGVFGRHIANGGRSLGAEFQVNQFTAFNQRSPVVAALPGGGFVVLWVSEQQRFENSVDIFGRFYNSVAQPTGNEFLVNPGDASNLIICANPTLTALEDGGFLAGWSQKDTGDADGGWNVMARRFDNTGSGSGPAVKINAHAQGDHYGPRFARNGNTVFALWTSYGQDGSREGVFGRFLSTEGEFAGDEFQVNTYSDNQQIHPAIAADGFNRFLAVWSSFVGGATSFDLLAQRYSVIALKPAAPFLAAISPSALSVTWPDAGPTTVAAYELYIDGSAQPVVATKMPWTLDKLAPQSTHTIRMAYRFPNGERSSLSEPGSGTTWGSDDNMDGLPDDWQRKYWGNDPSKWPSPNADSDGDGATNLQEFLAGTNPLDPNSALRTRIVPTTQGAFLHWNTQPGFVYQVQAKTDLTQNWTDISAPRFAADAEDSILVTGGSGTTYYRVKRLR